MGNINTGDIGGDGNVVGHNSLGVVNLGGGTVTINRGEIVPPAQVLVPRGQWGLQKFIGRQAEQVQIQSLYTQVSTTKCGTCCYLSGRTGTGGISVARAVLSTLSSSTPGPVVADLTFNVPAVPAAQNNSLPLQIYLAALNTMLPKDQREILQPLVAVLLAQLAAQSPHVQQMLLELPPPHADVALHKLLREAVIEQPLVLLVELTTTTPSWWLSFLDTFVWDHLPDLPILLLIAMETRWPLAEAEVLQLPAEQAQAHIKRNAATELRLPNLTESDLTDILDGNYQLADRLRHYTSGWPVLVEEIWKLWQKYGYIEQFADDLYDLTREGSCVLWSAHTDLFTVFLERPWEASGSAPFAFSGLERLLCYAALEGDIFTVDAVAQASDQDVASLQNAFALLGTDVVTHHGTLLDSDQPGQRLEQWCFVQRWVRLLLLHKLTEHTRYDEERMSAEMAEALEVVGGLVHANTRSALFDLWLRAESPAQAKRILQVAEALLTEDDLRQRIAELTRVFDLQATLVQEEQQSEPVFAKRRMHLPTNDEWRRLAALQRRAGKRALERYDLEQAARDFHAAMHSAQQARVPQDEAWALAYVGRTERLHKRYTQATSYLHQAQTLFAHQPTANEAGELGPAWVLIELGIASYMQGRAQEAHHLYEQAIICYQAHVDPISRRMALYLNNLGYLLRAQGNLAGAQPYWERALAINEQVLGPMHPDTATSLNNLGELLRAQGDLAGAQSYFERTLAICEQVLGGHHSQIQALREKLAELDERL